MLNLRVVDCLGFFGSLSTPAAARSPVRRRLTNQFSSPDRRHEFLNSVIVEIDRRSFGIRLCHSSNAILLVTDCLTLTENLQDILLQALQVPTRTLRGEYKGVADLLFVKFAWPQ